MDKNYYMIDNYSDIKCAHCQKPIFPDNENKMESELMDVDCPHCKKFSKIDIDIECFVTTEKILAEEDSERAMENEKNEGENNV